MNKQSISRVRGGVGTGPKKHITPTASRSQQLLSPAQQGGQNSTHSKLGNKNICQGKSLKTELQNVEKTGW